MLLGASILKFLKIILLVGYLHVSSGRSLIINKGSQIIEGKLFTSSVVLCCVKMLLKALLLT